MTPWELLTTCQGLRTWLAAVAARHGGSPRLRTWRLRSSKTRSYWECSESIYRSDAEADDDPAGKTALPVS